MAKYVVTGVTGRVGSVVARELVARGDTLRVVVRDASRGRRWAEQGAGVAVGSLDDQPFVSESLRGADGLFVLLPENISDADFHGARRRMADAVTAAVRISGVPHVVLLSAIAASLPDGNGPAKDLHYFENGLRTSGATLTTLRACYFQDNVGPVVPAAAQQGIYPSFFPSLDAAFPMIAAADVSRFAAAALATPPATSEIVDLMGPAYSAREIAYQLGAALGRAVQIVAIPPAEHVSALTRAGVPPALASAVAEMLAAFAAGRIAPCGDRQLMGTTTIERVIAECVRYYSAAAVSA